MCSIKIEDLDSSSQVRSFEENMITMIKFGREFQVQFSKHDALKVSVPIKLRHIQV